MSVDDFCAESPSQCDLAALRSGRLPDDLSVSIACGRVTVGNVYDTNFQVFDAETERLVYAELGARDARDDDQCDDLQVVGTKPPQCEEAPLQVFQTESGWTWCNEQTFETTPVGSVGAESSCEQTYSNCENGAEYRIVCHSDLSDQTSLCECYQGDEKRAIDVPLRDVCPVLDDSYYFEACRFD